MPRDIAALTAQFESSNNAEKTALFIDVINEIIFDIQRRAFISSSVNIRDTLEVFRYLDITSSKITLFTNQIRDSLINIQHEYNTLYSAQMEPISVFLEFLTSLQDSDFQMLDDVNSTYSSDDEEIKDDSKEDNPYGISSPVPIPSTTTHTSERNPQNYSTIVSGSYVSSGYTSFNGKMAYSLKDIEPRSFLGDDYDSGGGT